MPGTFVIVLDGVLRKVGTDAPNLQGTALYHSLASTSRVAVFCGPDRAKAEWFLRTNGMSKHAHLVPEDEAISPVNSGRRMGQITYLRSQSTNVEFVVEPDPDIAADLLRNGVPTLVYLHPQYTEPAFRPDYDGTPTPWQSLVDEVAHQIDMRTKNPTIFNPDDDS